MTVCCFVHKLHFNFRFSLTYLNLLQCNFVFVGEVVLEVSVTPSTGYFEISESDALVVSGKVHASDEQQLNSFFDNLPNSEISRENVQLNTSDVYKDLRLRGYEYEGLFKGINSVDDKGDYYEGKFIQCIIHINIPLFYF